MTADRRRYFQILVGRSARAARLRSLARSLYFKQYLWLRTYSCITNVFYLLLRSLSQSHACTSHTRFMKLERRISHTSHSQSEWFWLSDQSGIGGCPPRPCWRRPWWAGASGDAYRCALEPTVVCSLCFSLHQNFNALKNLTHHTHSQSGSGCQIILIYTLQSLHPCLCNL